MGEIIITNKTVSLTLVAGLILIAFAGAIGYNAGLRQGLQRAGTNQTMANLALPPAASTPTSNNTRSGAAANTNAPAEVPVSGGTVQLANSNVATGTITTLASNSFGFKVVSSNFNTVTGGFTQHTTAYQVKVTSATKISAQSTSVTISGGATPPKVTTTSKPQKFSDLKVGQTVTVGWTGSTSAANITATDITFASTGG